MGTGVTVEYARMETLPPCICGHEAIDHHTSWFVDGSGRVLYEECEFFGSNEEGGSEYVDGKWVEHCMRYCPQVLLGGPARGMAE